MLLINNYINYATYQQYMLKPMVLLHCTHASKKFITLYCSSRLTVRSTSTSCPSHGKILMITQNVSTRRMPCRSSQVSLNCWPLVRVMSFGSICNSSTWMADWWGSLSQCAVGDSLLNAMEEAPKTTCKQILSIIASSYTKDELQEMVPGLSQYAIDEARCHRHVVGAGQPVPTVTQHHERLCMKKAEHFIEFLSQPASYKMLPTAHESCVLTVESLSSFQM